MFDFLRKELIWDAWDEGLNKKIPGPNRFSLKEIQDLAVFSHLVDLKDKDIAEIGGGESRLLKFLAKQNRCFNVERFEGSDGGPSEESTIEGVTNILAYLGDFSDKLRNEAFDVVFSISVVEHVETTKLSSFLDDGLRILKPGGLWLHAIDMYLDDNPSEYFLQRFHTYKSWFDNGTLIPIGNIYNGPVEFSCDMATNPDNVMHSWSQRFPQHTALRKRAQSVSLILAAKKA